MFRVFARAQLRGVWLVFVVDGVGHESEDHAYAAVSSGTWCS